MVNKGDKVAYSVRFLRSIGCVAGDMAHARGIVESVAQIGRGPHGMILAVVKWDCDMPERVNVKNLAVVGHNRQFSNVD